MGKGGSGTAIAIGVVALIGGVFVWRTGMLCDSMNIGCEFKRGAESDESGTIQNKCWSVGNGKLACSCGGTEQHFIMGANRNCSDCESHCRGNPPTAAKKAGQGTGAGDRCYKQSTGTKGTRIMCACQGSSPFAMGAKYNAAPTACTACKVECHKRRTKSGLVEEFEPDYGAGLAFAGYTAMGRQDLNRLIVA